MFANLLTKGLVWFAAAILLTALAIGLLVAVSPFLVIVGVGAIAIGAL